MIKKPVKSGSSYFSYKQTFSVVLMATVDADQGFFLAEHAGTAFRNLFEGTKFQKSKNKIINKSSVSKDKEFSKLAHYLRPSC
jgi:hypothetical protein